MIEPGDKVVCVSAVLPCCGASQDGHAPVIGRWYIAGFTGIGKCVKCGEKMPCMQARRWPHKPAYGWPQACFVKPRTSDTDIFRLADAPVTPDMVPA